MKANEYKYYKHPNHRMSIKRYTTVGYKYRKFAGKWYKRYPANQSHLYTDKLVTTGLSLRGGSNSDACTFVYTINGTNIDTDMTVGITVLMFMNSSIAISVATSPAHKVPTEIADRVKHVVDELNTANAFDKCHHRLTLDDITNIINQLATSGGATIDSSETRYTAMSEYIQWFMSVTGNKSLKLDFIAFKNFEGWDKFLGITHIPLGADHDGDICYVKQ